MLGNGMPHPYFFFGPSSSVGEGYARVVGRAEGGIDMESAHAIFRALGAYDTGTKINDNDQPNPNGHDRYLEGAAYYRAARGWFAGWFAGAGLRWNQLSTTGYSKGGTRPEIGGGYDLMLRACKECRRDFSMRVNLDWVLAGTDWQNGSHGAVVTVTLPTPREKRHWFLRNCLSAYRFHTTVTEPQNLALTHSQRTQQGFAGGDEMGVVYRF
jgi:hypothetical protein